MRQQVIHSGDFAFGTARRKHYPGPVDQKIRMPPRLLQSFCIGADTSFANEAVGIQAAFQCHNAYFESLLCQHRDRLFRGIGARRIRVKVDHNPGSVTPQKPYLVLCERSAAGCQHVGDPGGKD